jgi:hypothetical protein
MGITEESGQWAIVGGTGELALAQGTIKHKAIVMPTENYRQLDIHAFYTPQAVSLIMRRKIYITKIIQLV